MNPLKRNILLATVLVCAITGVLSAQEVYAAQLVWGSEPVFHREWLSPRFRWWPSARAVFPVPPAQFHDILEVANVGSGMGAQIERRRAYGMGMGRNDAIPRRFFGVIEPVRRIPAK